MTATTTATYEASYEASHVVHDRPDRAAIKTALDRYIAKGSRLRKRLTGQNDGSLPLSLSLQQALYDERGLPG